MEIEIMLICCNVGLGGLMFNETETSLCNLNIFTYRLILITLLERVKFDNYYLKFLVIYICKSQHIKA